MAKGKDAGQPETSGEKDAGQLERGHNVDPVLAILAGPLAASVTVNGVMAGAHGKMIAAQAYRLRYELQQVGALIETCPEIETEPINEKAMAMLNDLVKKNCELDLAEMRRAEKFAAAEAAKLKDPTVPPAG